MCELAVATGRLPSEWAAEDPMAIATVIELLAAQAERAEQGRG